MGKLADNNKLLNAVKRDIVQLIEEMGAIRAEGIGDYTSLLARGQKTFNRMKNMDTRGDYKGLEAIISQYDNAIKLLKDELEAVSNNKDSEHYTDEDVKALKDLITIAKSSKEESIPGLEMEALKVYTSRMEKENSLLSQRAIREVEEKIDAEKEKIKEAKAPINDVYQQIGEDRLQRFYDADEAKAIFSEWESKKDKVKELYEKLKNDEGLDKDQIEADSRYKTASEELQSSHKKFIEASKKFPACKSVSREGKKPNEYIKALKDALDLEYGKVEQEIEGILNSNSSKSIVVAEYKKNAKGEYETTLNNKTLEQVIGNGNVKQKLEKLKNEKSKIANYVREKDTKILEYQEEQKLYSADTKEKAMIDPDDKKGQFNIRRQFLMQQGVSKWMAWFRAKFTPGRVNKQMEKAREEENNNNITKYYKRYHEIFAEKYNVKRDNAREAQQIAKGQIDDEIFVEFKAQKTKQDQDQDHEGR